MVNYALLLTRILLIVGLTSCIPRRKKSETISDFHFTGVAIAVDNYIQEYENEHQKFYEEETKDGGILPWPELDSKNLSNYCKKYLQHAIPTRSTDSAIGNKIIKTLQYKMKNTSITNNVVLVHCKIVNKHRILSYYMTRASVPSCVYALICTRSNSQIKFIIVNKYCNFEDKLLLVCRSLKQRRTELVGRIHITTGEPIAKDNYLFQYELEHQEMVIKKGEKGKCFVWLHAMLHHNLNCYCYQYMRKSAPSRDRNNVIGMWKTEKLHYRKLNKREEIYVTVVTCQPLYPMRWSYHFTRAPETNCVYALLRLGHNLHHPMVIIFKHCDFETSNDQQSIFQQHDIVQHNIYPKTEVKEEMYEAKETLELFPKD